MSEEDSVYATKFYSMQKQIDDQEETIKILRARETIFNDLCRQYREENDILHSTIKEVREYAGELRLYDNESIEFEISNDLFRILDKEENNG